MQTFDLPGSALGGGDFGGSVSPVAATPAAPTAIGIGGMPARVDTRALRPVSHDDGLLGDVPLRVLMLGSAVALALWFAPAHLAAAGAGSPAGREGPEGPDAGNDQG